jgi:signal transduction histidine kinase/CheY-like chemotaxis protein/HPt (histidine-containing phosphotransfer) domain-containing protein
LILATEKRTKSLLWNLAAAHDREIAKGAQLEQARSDAEAGSRAKSAFLATMSHEIRTPMNGVIGMAEVLTRSTLAAEQKEMVCTIRDCASALLKIIDDILDFSKIEAGKLQIDCVPTSIEDIVDSMASSLATVADARGVALRTYVSPALPPSAMFDDTRLREILYNLVGNAIKFSAGRSGVQGNVALRAMPVPGETPFVRFDIIDNGIGMTAETMANLFQPFSQAEASTTRRFGGTGLGLAICRRLVSLMGGELTVQSEPGRGSVFTVALPLHRVEGAEARKFADLSGLACIVVASHDWRCDDTADYLRHAGAKVEIAADAYDARQALARADGPRILVHDANCSADSVAPNVSDAAASLIGDVLIAAQRSVMLTTRTGNTVSIGAQALRRRVLIDAVALAAGRADTGALAREQEGNDDVLSRLPANEGVMLLVAEDDDVNRRVISRQLALLGYAADMAVDGEQALEMWRAKPYTLVVTDLHMPRRDGYELAQAIRAEEAHEARDRVPIVALTANAITGEANRAKALGIDDYLTKPLKLDLLAQALAQWTHPRHACAPGKAIESGAVADAAAESQMEAARCALPAFDRQTESACVAAVPSPIDAAPNRAIVDISVLKEIVGDDMETVQALLVEYAECSSELAEHLRAYLATSRGSEAAAIAHKLKSSSRSIGALPLGDLCADIEARAIEGDAATLAQLGAQFDAIYRRTLELVRTITLSANTERAA